MSKVAKFSSTTRVQTHDLLKVCDPDGWNMFHAAVVYKRIDIITKILEYGTGMLFIVNYLNALQHTKLQQQLHSTLNYINSVLKVHQYPVLVARVVELQLR